MRVVLDTNVLVSGLLTPHGASARVLDLMLAGDLVPLVDDRIMDEYRAVLHRPRFGFAPADVATLLAYLTTWAEPIVARPLALELPDPDDVPFLEVASAGAAEALITGNPRHFHPVRGEHRVRIVGPGPFLAVG